ncbi:unnamed protein product [Discosporangium mesarthrocarpum]
MGGTMGGVLQIFFNSGEAALAARAGAGTGVGAGRGWTEAFVAGVEGVKLYGGAEVGMRTVLDAVIPAAMVLQKEGAAGFGAAVAAAEAGAESTRGMEASAGRANYVGTDGLRGVPDPGAKAAAVAMRAVAGALGC